MDDDGKISGGDDRRRITIRTTHERNGKAAITAATLGRLMPNIGEPKEEQGRLLNSVVHSKILYGAEVWGDAIKRANVKRKMIYVQRRSVHRVICAYKTVSASAALVLASTPPIDHLIQERQELYAEYKKSRTQRRAIKLAATERLLVKWQRKWETEKWGRWTHTLIPNLSEWYKRRHGLVDFYLTQALTGHACFNEYQANMGKRESSTCSHCNFPTDDAHYTIFRCTATTEARRELEIRCGVELNEQNIVPCMLTDENRWQAVARYITMAIKQKEQMVKQEENRRQVPPNP